MLKKTVTYEDFDGNQVTEDLYFNLTQAEVMEMNMESGGALSERYQKIIDAQDTASLIKEFKRLILKAYGVKSVDGKRFIKNDQLREEFESSAAYSAIFMELATNTDAATAFANGILPKVKDAEPAKTPALN